MPGNCYYYSVIILTAIVDLLPFAVILHSENNASDNFTTGKLMKKINILMTRKAYLASRPWDSSIHWDGHERCWSCNPLCSQHREWINMKCCILPPRPSNSCQQQNNLLYHTNTDNLCYSVQPAGSTDIKISHSHLLQFISEVPKLH